MKAQSTIDTEKSLGVTTLDSHFDSLKKGINTLVGPYLIPTDSGKKCALAKDFSAILLRESGVFLCYDEWGVWPSAQNLDLFDGYRRSLGEDRKVWEAPVHILGPTEGATFISLLSLGLYFVWDVGIFDQNGTFLAIFSHDEWMEFYVSEQTMFEEIAQTMKEFGLEKF